jgi:hypothetical protein
MQANKCAKPITDSEARAVEKLWQKYFPSALLLPVIGLPSNAQGVLTLTHQMNGSPPMKINGLTSKSALANNALYSSEVSDGKYLNLYEIMVAAIPGKHGEPSTDQIYINLLEKYGLDTAGVHFHWTGGWVYPNDHGVTAIHHQNIGLTPEEFSRRTIKALLKVMKVIDARTKKDSSSSSSDSSSEEDCKKPHHKKPKKKDHKEDDKKPWTWDNVTH